MVRARSATPRAGPLAQFRRHGDKPVQTGSVATICAARRATRLADAGKTVHQIAAVSGHKTLKEIERYTRQADQRRLAREALLGKQDGSAEREAVLDEARRTHQRRVT
jgi:hypothetical protein